MAELGYRFLGAFGAILTILTLAFHTLIQNAISTRSGKLEIDSFYGDPIYGASYPQGNNYTTMYNKYSASETLGIKDRLSTWLPISLTECTTP